MKWLELLIELLHGDFGEWLYFRNETKFTRVWLFVAKALTDINLKKYSTCAIHLQHCFIVSIMRRSLPNILLVRNKIAKYVYTWLTTVSHFLLECPLTTAENTYLEMPFEFKLAETATVVHSHTKNIGYTTVPINVNMLRSKRNTKHSKELIYTICNIIYIGLITCWFVSAVKLIYSFCLTSFAVYESGFWLFTD